MAKITMEIKYNKYDNEGMDPGSDLFYRDVKIMVDVSPHMTRTDIYRALISFMAVMGHSTKEIEELMN